MKLDPLLDERTGDANRKCGCVQMRCKKSGIYDAG